MQCFGALLPVRFFCGGFYERIIFIIMIMSAVVWIFGTEEVQ